MTSHAAPGPAASGRLVSLACEVSAVVVAAVVVVARLHPAPSEPSLLPWERPLAAVDPGAVHVVRAAFAALADVERGVARGAPPSVAALADDVVPPFSDPAFTFARVIDGDITGYVGRGGPGAPLLAVLLVVQPTTPPPADQQDEEHHRVVDAAGQARWLHGSVWFVEQGRPPPRPGVAAPVALGYLRARPGGPP